MSSGRLSFNPSQANDDPGLAGKVVRFSGFLKRHGFKVFQTSVHDAVASLIEIGPFIKEDFYTALRSNLVSNNVEWEQFKSLFEEFWDPKNEILKTLPDEEYSDAQTSPGNSKLSEICTLLNVLDEDVPEPNGPDQNIWLDVKAYSPLTGTDNKEFICFDPADISIAHKAVKKIAEPFRNQDSRRRKKSKKPRDFDFPRIMQLSLKYEGLPIELKYKAKRKKLKRLVFLIDVSGSMDRYARFVLPFILSLKGIGPRTETFVFSTRISNITHVVRNVPAHSVFDYIAREIPNWSGGTRIGHSLHQFNTGLGRRFLNRRTVVVILSDGWDLGETGLLDKEMHTLRRNVDHIIWLNPLSGDPDYQPLCRGMKTALPYVDYFLPADSLKRLKAVGDLLARIVKR